jgi:hypothetical protein
VNRLRARFCAIPSSWGAWVPYRTLHSTGGSPDLFAITISVTDGKGHVVLADQVHEEASSCRVELTFPLGTKPEAGFADREEQIIRDARAVLAAALVAFDRR